MNEHALESKPGKHVVVMRYVRKQYTGSVLLAGSGSQMLRKG